MKIKICPKCGEVYNNDTIGCSICGQHLIIVKHKKLVRIGVQLSLLDIDWTNEYVIATIDELNLANKRIDNLKELVEGIKKLLDKGTNRNLIKKYIDNTLELDTVEILIHNEQLGKYD